MWSDMIKLQEVNYDYIVNNIQEFRLMFTEYGKSMEVQDVEKYTMERVEKLKSYCQNKNTHITVAYIDSSISGFIWCFFINNKIHIKSIIIKKEYKRQGIGSRLLDYTEKHLDSNNVLEIDLIVLESNYSAKEFYKNHGYVVSKYIMTKRKMNNE